MSGIYKSMVRGSTWIAKKGLPVLAAFGTGYTAGGAAAGTTAAASAASSNKKTSVDVSVPSEPTVDEAQKNLQEYDRLRRRRGVLANIFGGSSGSSPTVGTKTLLGG